MISNFMNMRNSFISHKCLTLSSRSGLPSHGTIGRRRNGVHVDFLPVNSRLVSCQWFNDLRANNQLFLNNQDASVIFMDAWMVSARCYGHEIIREFFDTVWAYGVRSNHHAKIISLKEWIEVVWAEVYDMVFAWADKIIYFYDA